MIIHATRLKIVPLSLFHLQNLLHNKPLQNIDFQPTKFDEETNTAMCGLYQEGIKNQEQWFWFTNWQIVLKQTHQAVGSCCFVHPPDKNGSVEIGYGIDVQFRNQGFMTEAAQVFCQWAMQKDEVKCVTAQTDKVNHASNRVLEKIGMKCVAETDEMYFWSISKKQ